MVKAAETNDNLGQSQGSLNTTSRSASLYEICFFVIIVLAMLLLAYGRNALWENDLFLWKDTVHKSYSKARAHDHYGLALEVSKDYLKAKAHYERSIYLDNNFANPYNNLGIVYLRLEKFDEAKKNYIKAIAIDSYFPDPYNNLGVIHAKYGELEKAEKNYRKAIELSPYYGAAHLNLGVLLINQDRVDESVRVLTKACDLLNQDKRCLYALGVSYEHVGDLRKSMKLYLSTLIEDPYFTKSIYRMGKIYLKLGESDLAKEMFRNYLDIDPGNQDVIDSYQSLTNGS